MSVLLPSADFDDHLNTSDASELDAMNLKREISPTLLCSNDSTHSCETSEVISSMGENSQSSASSLDEWEAASSSWTEFEHESYLNTMESNFVQNMYNRNVCELDMYSSLERLHSSLEPETRHYTWDYPYYADNFVTPSGKGAYACFNESDVECRATEEPKLEEKRKDSNVAPSSHPVSMSKLPWDVAYPNGNPRFEIEDASDSTLSRKQIHLPNTKFSLKQSFVHHCLRQHKCSKMGMNRSLARHYKKCKSQGYWRNASEMKA